MKPLLLLQLSVSQEASCYTNLVSGLAYDLCFTRYFQAAEHSCGKLIQHELAVGRRVIGPMTVIEHKAIWAA